MGNNNNNHKTGLVFFQHRNNQKQFTFRFGRIEDSEDSEADIKLATC